MYRKKQIPNRLKAKIVERDHGICQNCGRVGRITEFGARSYPFWRSYQIINNRQIAFEIGHIIPECMGGELIEENLILMCRRCNRSLGGKIWRKNE